MGPRLSAGVCLPRTDCKVKTTAGARRAESCVGKRETGCRVLVLQVKETVLTTPAKKRSSGLRNRGALPHPG